MVDRCCCVMTAMMGLAGVGEPVQAKAPGPNGRIAFESFDPTLGHMVTYTANPDGSHRQQLYFGGMSAFPDWSPDGSQVSIGTPCTDGTETCAATIVDPDSGAFRQFKWPDPTLETDCGHWSPDGQRLACVGFGVTDPSRNGIYTIRSSDGVASRGSRPTPAATMGQETTRPTGRAWCFSARTKAAPWASSWSSSTGAGCDRSRRLASSRTSQKAETRRAKAGRRAGTRSCS